MKPFLFLSVLLLAGCSFTIGLSGDPSNPHNVAATAGGSFTGQDFKDVVRIIKSR